MSESDELPRLELRIPGAWDSPRELFTALDDRKLGYRFDDDVLIHLETGKRFDAGTSPHDDEIAEIFADTGRLSEREIQDIAAHTVKIHLSCPGGSIESAREMMHAAAAILRAGGSGVFIDNSGNAHSPRDWHALASDKQLGGVYWAYVAMTASEDEVFSVGMHCLGFRDAELFDPPGREQGGYMLHNFLGYSYQSGTAISDGDPIGDEHGATHRVRHVPCTRFLHTTAFFNPYGVWRLVRMDAVDNE